MTSEETQMVQVVITIPASVLENVRNDCWFGSFYNELKNCIVLPKGHGRLIDADELDSITVVLDERGLIKRIDAPTIVKADKEE